MSPIIAPPPISSLFSLLFLMMLFGISIPLTFTSSPPPFISRDLTGLLPCLEMTSATESFLLPLVLTSSISSFPASFLSRLPYRSLECAMAILLSGSAPLPAYRCFPSGSNGLCSRLLSIRDLAPENIKKKLIYNYNYN